MAIGGIQGLEQVIRRVGKLATDIRQVERPMRAAGVYMVGSMQRNFKEEGRPAKWAPLAPSTILRRRRGSGRGGIKIMSDTKSLSNSISERFTTAGEQIGVPTGVKKPNRAKRLHFGYPGGSGRGHAKTPARPYIMIQAEDYDAIAQIFSRHYRLR